MAAHAPRRRLLLQLVAVIGGLLVLWFVVLPFAVLWSFHAGSREGAPFDVARAHRVVAEQRELLDEIRALRPDDGSAAATRRRGELAAQLGALAIGFERTGDARAVVVVFHRWGGAGETYEHRLCWLPPGARPPTGEERVAIADGWWWVWW